MHWLNAIAFLILISSGWGIYDDNRLFDWLRFPYRLAIGEWSPMQLLWHFAAMWLLVINGLAYLVYGFASGRFRARLLPVRAGDVIRVLRETLRLQVAREDLNAYNAVQKLLYILVILAGILQVVTGLALWKPIQYSSLTALFGGFQGARLVHFVGMSVIVAFLVVHVTLALLAPRRLLTMVTGGTAVPGRQGAR